MPIEIKELVIRAIVSPPQEKGGGIMQNKKKKKLEVAQEALSMVNYVLKNEKER